MGLCSSQSWSDPCVVVWTTSVEAIGGLERAVEWPGTLMNNERRMWLIIASSPPSYVGLIGQPCPDLVGGNLIQCEASLWFQLQGNHTALGWQDPGQVKERRGKKWATTGLYG